MKFTAYIEKQYNTSFNVYLQSNNKDDINNELIAFLSENINKNEL